MEDKDKKENKYAKYLPIGTVVLLRDGKKRVMITGFAVKTKFVDKDRIFDYCGVIYPEGMISKESNVLFDHIQISKIYHMGLYNDSEEKEFKEKLNSIMKENM